jgi:hypothetical protein
MFRHWSYNYDTTFNTSQTTRKILVAELMLNLENLNCAEPEGDVQHTMAHAKPTRTGISLRFLGMNKSLNHRSARSRL